MQINSNNHLSFGCSYCTKARQILVEAGMSSNKADEYISRSISDIDSPVRNYAQSGDFFNENSDIAGRIINESCDHESKAAFVASMVKNSADTIVNSCKTLF